MESWVFASLLAALLQTIRFMLQKTLATSRLSTAGATFSRFVYSAPVLWAAAVVYFAQDAHPIPQITADFWVYGTIGGLSQILATLCVVALFKSRNFAVGVTFKKTETILAAILGFVVLGEWVTLPAMIAILLGVLGVLVLSKSPRTQDTTDHWFFNRATGLGVLSGLLFAICAVTYRATTLSVASDIALVRSGISLLFVVSVQTVSMAIWLYVQDTKQLAAVWRARRSAIWIGLTSLGGSYMWFTAFTLQNVAYVKAVGQVELIFSVLASVLFFREKITLRELAAVFLIVSSVLGLLLVTG